ncbi:hypothetical protein RIF29_14420 [Crotalaria pallida]|uniref:Pentatricopeptide repeat-containing protein n=1 Tax=Crotalaria pallida TaxID=3830 RepID=A0AAN9II90_CROPI
MEQVFKSLMRSKEKPSLPTFNSMILNYGKARYLFDGLVESHGRIRVSTLHAMLDVYCINGLPQEADSLFESTRSIKVLSDSSMYKLLYKAYTKANSKELLDKLLINMDKDGIISNKRFFMDALGAIGSLPAKSGSNSTAANSNNPQDLAKAQLEM